MRISDWSSDVCSSDLIMAQVEDTGADGVELNFGCPHGMSERGMGSAVGQVPEYIEMVTRWVKAASRMPVIVKLTPNITDIRYPARAAHQGGADAVSLINTVSSITAVDLDSFSPERSEERRVGKECVSTCRSRWSPYHEKKQT